MVDEAWNGRVKQGMEAHGLMRRLNNTTEALSRWNKDWFGKAHEHIKNIELELALMHETGNLDKGKQSLMEANLREQRTRLECIYQQQSRDIWLKEGYRNTKFFHTFVLIKRRRNHFHAIRDGNLWLTKRNQIKDYFLKEFQNLFKSNKP